MKEYIATAHVNHIAPMITQLSWTTPCYMYLEQLPTTWTAPQGAQDGLQLRHYAETTPFDNWQRGRVFNHSQELKWDTIDQTVHAVYCGPTAPDTFTVHPTDIVTETNRQYFAWGTRVQADDQAMLGIEPTSMAFIDVQIPRILVYPVSEQAHYIQISVREWYDHNGQLWYSRWTGIEEVSKTIAAPREEEHPQ